ncbi:Succinate dehydrogenase subunit 7B, mitochondrial [Linum grandiflorum]
MGSSCKYRKVKGLNSKTYDTLYSALIGAITVKFAPTAAAFPDSDSQNKTLLPISDKDGVFPEELGAFFSLPSSLSGSGFSLSSWIPCRAGAAGESFELVIMMQLLADDPAIRRFKSTKKGVARINKIGDFLTVVVVAGCCYEIYVKAVMREESRKRAEDSA